MKEKTLAKHARDTTTFDQKMTEWEIDQKKRNKTSLEATNNSSISITPVKLPVTELGKDSSR